MYNRPLALLLTVPVVLLSVLLSGGGHLASEKTKIEQFFFSGVDADGYGIAKDLVTRAEAAYNMAVLLEDALGKEDGDVAAVYTLHKEMQAEERVSLLYGLDQQLQGHVQSLEGRLGGLSLSEETQRLFQRQYADFASFGHTIKQNTYNFQADAFNQRLLAFPANLISKLYGVKPIEAFR